MQETPGFGVRTRARFGLIPVTVAARDSVPIGPVVARTAAPLPDQHPGLPAAAMEMRCR